MSESGSEETAAAGSQALDVLIVDDDPLDAELMSRELRHGGFDPESRRVDKETTFVDALDDATPDVILADYEIPGFGGLRALDIVVERALDIPFVLVSGRMDDDIAVGALQRGADDYLLKDRLGRLPSAVTQALKQKRLRAREREARAKLRRTEDLLHLLAENARDLIFRIRLEPELACEYASAAVRDLTGLETESMAEHAEVLIARLHPADRDRFMEALLDPNPDQPIRVRWMRDDGTFLWSEARLVPVRSTGGRIVAVEGIARDVTEQQRREQELNATVTALRRLDAERLTLVSRLVAAQEEERERIAADIHDDSLQVVVAVGLRLDILARRLRDPADLEEIDKLRNLIERCIARLRGLMFDLRPPALDREGLVAALRGLLEQIRSDDAIHYDLLDALSAEPPSEQRLLLFRIAQEAITNVRKHARASCIRLAASDDDAGFRLTIEDDGIGIDPERAAGVPGHLGVVAMRERAQLAGGWCRFERRQPTGTTVTLWVPKEA